ncbi:sensor histidine kinase [Lederbergia citrea]|uniref:Sensor histidine kinase n=1 Tax=Lederbergia citrea TaxID=2833581 RepID=A0A942URM4_9BACI|nr:sensor histidine kinase [Lederbergia citrea]MBS4176018.1 sensor histidine kinase [Lederbergia citrea]MBS4202580.1 sensor histidine kinase [Lederbergia citrea]MBS4222754.1 sensor histidine kinase [Lederbergia citrea]
MKITKNFQLIQTSIRLKLFLLFNVVALIPLILFGFISYGKSTKLVNSQFGEYGEISVSQLQKQIESTLNHMHYISSNIQLYLSDPTLIVLEKKKAATYSEFIAKKNFLRFLEAHKAAETKGIFLITKDGHYYSNTYLDYQKLQREPFWKNYMEIDKTKEYWTGLYTPNHYYKDNQDKVIGLLMPTSLTYGLLDGSWILIETNATDLFKSIQNLEINLHSFITIRDEHQNIVYRTSGEYKEAASDIVWSKGMQSNNWSVEVRIPEKEFYKSSDVILYVTLIGIVVLLFIIFLLAYPISNKFTLNIRNLDKAIKKVSSGDFNTQIQITSRDEVGNLATNFNKMVLTIRELIQKIYEKEQLKKEAELLAVHYQINPHLLFNTLNSVQWKAKLHGADDVSQMIYHLVQILQENLNFSNELVPLKDELIIIDHYLKVQEIRFGEHFSYNKEIPEGLDDCLIPRMSLQPLFENIFFHAFDDGSGKICLEVMESNRNMILKITDDGRGIPESKISTLIKPPIKRKGRGGIGMYNVDQKFKLHFGDEYGITVESKEGEGTLIQINWPKRVEGEENDESDQSVDS